MSVAGKGRKSWSCFLLSQQRKAQEVTLGREESSFPGFPSFKVDEAENSSSATGQRDE